MTLDFQVLFQIVIILEMEILYTELQVRYATLNNLWKMDSQKKKSRLNQYLWS